MGKKMKTAKDSASICLRVAVSEELLANLRERAAKESRKLSALVRLILEKDCQSK